MENRYKVCKKTNKYSGFSWHVLVFYSKDSLSEKIYYTRAEDSPFPKEAMWGRYKWRPKSNLDESYNSFISQGLSPEEEKEVLMDFIKWRLRYGKPRGL